MMYSDQDIQRALQIGDLVVTPCTPEMIKPAGLTLHLGALLLKPDNQTIVDIKRKITPKYEEIIIGDDTPYQIDPGEFLLGHTYEHVTVGDALGFFIEGRSTLARLGLTVVQTAMLVYPGHRNRTITLELANHGPNPILLYPRMKIARAAIVELKTPSIVKYDDKGKYRGQELVGPPVFEHEIATKE
jgi:dCTP deaminase